MTAGDTGCLIAATNGRAADAGKKAFDPIQRIGAVEARLFSAFGGSPMADMRLSARRPRARSNPSSIS